MDPKAQMPDIKSEVNKVDDGKKKASGLLSGLFGGGGASGGAAGGLGGLGAGAVSGGGLLATKAGMLALVLMGSAVAGGIGLAGYKMFGPGDEAKTGGNLQLFAAKPQQATDANGVAPVNADGSSASLSFAAAAAAKDKAAEAALAAADGSASAGAPTDKTAGDAAKDAAAAEAAKREADAKSAASAGGAINAGSGAAAAAGSMGHGLANVKKLGGLSTGGGGGASTSAGSGSGGRLGDNLANAAKNGPSSAFSRQSGGAAKTSSNGGARAVGGRGRSARKELGMVSGDHMGGNVGSSYGAGKTYDGSATRSGGAIGPDGGAIGMDGAGDGAGAQPKSLAANSAANTKKQDPPIPEPPAKDVTPWAKQIMIGMGLGALAVVALMYAASMLKEAKAAAVLALGATPVGTVAYAAAVAQMQLCKVIIGAAILAALGGALMGGMISGGQNGQVLQGGLLIASSLAIAAAGVMLFSEADIPATVEGGKTSLAEKNLGAFAAPSTWIYVIGGIGAIGLVGTMMSPKKTCKSDEDGCHAYYQQQRAHPTFLA